MAHMLDGDKEVRFVERYSEKDGRAWHALGTVVDKDFAGSVVDMFGIAGADISVVKVPQYGLLPDGTMVQTDKFLLYREPHTLRGELLPGGFIPDAQPVSADYTVIDNLEIARLLEPLNKQWPVETVGLIKGGSIVFVAMRAGKFAIKGKDEHEMFFVLSDGKNGVRSLRIDVTPVRTVCNNTLQMGIAAAHMSAKIDHTRNAGREIAFWQEAMPQMQQRAGQVQDALELMADTKATKANVMEIIQAAFPLPGRSDIANTKDQGLSLSDEAKLLVESENNSADYHRNRILKIQDMVWEEYDIFNQQHRETAGTLFAAAQSANRVAVWRNGHKDTMAASVVFGSRAGESQRAFGKAYEIATNRKVKAKSAPALV